MADNQKQLDELNKKLYLVELRQQQINSDLQLIKKELNQLTASSTGEPIAEAFPKIDVNKTTPFPVIEEVVEPIQLKPIAPPTPKKKKEKTPIEEFIGTNLLNKIGIAVLVIGIGIGAKYAIDHELISPLTRIVLGYLCGFILIGLALRLKPNYGNFSAVLLSGGMAVLYFITFAAYDLYELMPKMVAFVVMFIFTAFTVFAAMQYNRQVIAIIGLVGAYGVPFLLSDGSGDVAALFTYMAILNAGILLLSFKKTWKALYYSAFILTWLIYVVWIADRYQSVDHLWISLIFSSVFFVTFYITLLSYKLLQQEPLSKWDIVLLMSNSFLFYGFGYYVIDEHPDGDFFLGLFTLFNALIHFIACYIIYKKQNATRDTFYFVAGLVLVFLTLAVPVQLEGNWVTLVWAGESVLLFWIGRSKKFPVYERLSYLLILLTAGSLVQDWDDYYGMSYYYGRKEFFVPFFLNIQFFSSLLVCAALAAIVYISRKKSEIISTHWSFKIAEWIIPSLFLVMLFFSFQTEIQNYWEQRHSASEVITLQDGYNYSVFDTDLPLLKNIWLMIYASFFFTLLALINNRWMKNAILGYVVTGFSALLLFNFVTTGLSDLSQLRDSFLMQLDSRFYYRNSGNITIRYISMAFMIPLLVIVYKSLQTDSISDVLRKSERVFFHFIVLALLSSELINILELLNVQDSDKLALSILWGAYALGLIIFGLMKDLKFVRITAIAIFGVTLIKLFFYDLSSMGTIAKTIVMMVLGALLLIASFLYNKFKKTTVLSESDDAVINE
jgi:hypothetical protein